MAKFPRDEFDDIPTLSRVGAHRAPARKGRGWIRFAWAALATGVLVLAGVIGLALVNDSFQFELPSLAGESSPPPTEAPPATAEPVTDPSTVDPALGLTITVLNASPVDELDEQIGDTLEEQGWPVGARNTAADRDFPDTIVFYNGEQFEGIARGILAAIGEPGDVQLSDAYPGAPVTVVLGADRAE